jgi:cell division protease FtsH
MGSSDKGEQILNQLLIGMGAASMRAMNLSSCQPVTGRRTCLSAPRFDRQVVVEPPDRKGCTDILRINACKMCFSANVELSILARPMSPR